MEEMLPMEKHAREVQNPGQYHMMCIYGLGIFKEFLALEGGKENKNS